MLHRDRRVLCLALPFHVVCAQLEYRLEQERRQRGELEKSRRRLEGDSRSTQESLGEMEKNRSGLEDLIKRSNTHTHLTVYKKVLLSAYITKWRSKRAEIHIQPNYHLGLEIEFWSRSMLNLSLVRDVVLEMETLAQTLQAEIS